MAKEELIEMEGTVTEVMPDSRYRVELENGHEISAYAAGKMRKYRIRVVAGDNWKCPPTISLRDASVSATRLELLASERSDQLQGRIQST